MQTIRPSLLAKPPDIYRFLAQVEHHKGYCHTLLPKTIKHLAHPQNGPQQQKEFFRRALHGLQWAAN